MHGHQSSTDSTIGESKCITTSLEQPDPVSHTNRYNSTDSAVSNHYYLLSETESSYVDFYCHFNSQVLLTSICPVVLVSIMSPGLSITSSYRDWPMDGLWQPPPNLMWHVLSYPETARMS